MSHRKKTKPPAQPLTGDERSERDRRVATIKEKLAAAERSFYEIGEELRPIHKKRLYREDGTFEQFCRKHFGFGRRRGYVLMEIAAKFAPERAIEGEMKLRAGLEYLRVTPEEDRPADLARIEFDVPEGNETKKLRWPEATAEDIERATRLLRRQLKKESQKIPVEARSFRRALEHRVRGVEVGLRVPAGQSDPADVTVSIVSAYPQLRQTCRTALEILKRAAARPRRGRRRA